MDDHSDDESMGKYEIPLLQSEDDSMEQYETPRWQMPLDMSPPPPIPPRSPSPEEAGLQPLFSAMGSAMCGVTGHGLRLGP